MNQLERIALPPPFRGVLNSVQPFSGRPSLTASDGFLGGLLTAGTLTLQATRREIPVSEGALWAIRANQLKRPAYSGSGSGFELSIDGDDVEALFHLWDLTGQRPFTPAFYPHRTHLLFQQMAHNIRTPGAQHPLYFLTRLLRIAEYQQRKNTIPAEERHLSITEQSEEIWKCNPAIPLEETARQIGVSPTTLRNAFSLIHHGPPVQRRRRIQLDIAKKLLFETDRKISDIGAEAGFPNEKYFITWFRTHEGLTPGNWRKRNRRNAG